MVNTIKEPNKELWFKSKTYGWGWVPATWQGWLIVLGYVLVMILLSLDMSNDTQPNTESLINFIVPFIVGTILLLYICYKKGEKPRWRWGKDTL